MRAFVGPSSGGVESSGFASVPRAAERASPAWVDACIASFPIRMDGARGVGCRSRGDSAGEVGRVTPPGDAPRRSIPGTVCAALHDSKFKALAGKRQEERHERERCRAGSTHSMRVRDPAAPTGPADMPDPRMAERMYPPIPAVDTAGDSQRPGRVVSWIDPPPGNGLERRCEAVGAVRPAPLLPPNREAVRRPPSRLAEWRVRANDVAGRFTAPRPLLRSRGPRGDLVRRRAVSGSPARTSEPAGSGPRLRAPSPRGCSHARAVPA